MVRFRGGVAHYLTRRYKRFTIGKMNNMEWNIDPVLFSFGSLKVHWYGVLFALGIASGFKTMKRIFINEKRPLAELDSLLVTSIICLLYTSDAADD